MRSLALFVAVMSAATTATAHVVQQLHVAFTVAGGSWQADVTMDAGFAWPEFRDDPDAPQPSLEWLQSRTPREFATLRAESEQLLRRHLEFRSGSTVLPWTCGFPDFDSFPPDFPELPGRAAFLTVRIAGALPEPGTPLSVRELTGGPPDFAFQTGADTYLTLRPGEILTLTESPAAVVDAAFPHFFSEGFRHVLPLGWDHILFILAMFLMDRRLRPVLLQSLCFTAAHTITLGLAMAGILSVPGRIVEPLIALSIAGVAAENLLASRVRPHRLALIFGFGLVHGLGFGGALAAVLQSSGGPLPLLAANLGVEGAQVTILLAAAAAFRLLPPPAHPKTVYGLNLILVVTGLAVFVSRLMA